MQPPVPPPPEASGCAALGLRSMSCTAFSLIIAYIVLLPLLLLFVRVRAVHAKGDPVDLRSLLGEPDHASLDKVSVLCIVTPFLGECVTRQLACNFESKVFTLHHSGG